MTSPVTINFKGNIWLVSLLSVPPAGHRIAYEMDLPCVVFQSPLYAAEPAYMDPSELMGVCSLVVSLIFFISHTPSKKQAWELASTCKHKDKSGSATLFSDNSMENIRVSDSTTPNTFLTITCQKHSQHSQVLVRIVLKSWGERKLFVFRF